jgi:hypothetical protein
MKTLHELAQKLQEYIIRSQQDAHNSTNMNITKYNNLKLKMNSKYHYAHVIITIGISEAVFNISDGTKTDGGLGPDEKYVRKWLGTSSIVSDLKEIYIAMSDLIKAEDEDKSIAMEGESDEAKADAPKKKSTFRQAIEMAMPTMDCEISSDEEPKEEYMSVEEATQHQITETQEIDENAPESVEQVKKGLQNYIKSMFRQK